MCLQPKSNVLGMQTLEEKTAYINALLPQTQCRQCGFAGCKPYAQALAKGEAPPNLCPPGGKKLWQSLKKLSKTYVQKQSHTPPMSWQARVACIDIHACIGCYKCVKACPVDAIVGAPKHLHQVIGGACTGCDLCVPVCPVDCIKMYPVQDHAKMRAHTARAKLYTQRQIAWEEKNRVQNKANIHASTLQRDDNKKYEQRQLHTQTDATIQTQQPLVGAHHIRIRRLHSALQRARKHNDQQAVEKLTKQLAKLYNHTVEKIEHTVLPK